MRPDIDAMLAKLGGELINSPFLSVMIVNRKYQVVWHNQRFADDFNGGKQIENTCFQTIGSQKVHENCPLQKSIREKVCVKGFLDMGERSFLFLTIPIDGEHAAKVHIFLPKEPDNRMEETPTR